MTKSGSSKTVFVGLSGGVDSSVAALRLKNAGYNVVGVFIKVWHPDFLVCNWEQERLDAMRVAAHLEIPFLTCDGEAAYRDAVAHYFIESYRAGLTPNPDVMCNKEVKFGAFLEFAKANGADYIATGHYAQKGTGESGATELWRGLDQSKDQSYFLWSLSREQLAMSLFPIGDTTKDEVREEANRAGLPTAAKKDSQGVCFLGHIDIPEFLSHYIDLKPGPVLSDSGAVIGEHQGAFVYTIGQRHGFTTSQESDNTRPWYVIAKDVTKNTITVSHTPPLTNAHETLTLTNIVWRGDVPPALGARFAAQFRYRQTPVTVEIKGVTDSEIDIEIIGQSERPARGQSCVLYEGGQCQGGGMMA